MSPVLFLKRPTAWLEAISQYRGTVSFAPNFAYELCLRRVKPSQIDALDLSSWRVAGCGAEPIRADTLQAFADRFASAGFRASSFVPSYGLAEHSLAVALRARRHQVDARRRRRASVRESRAVPGRLERLAAPVRIVGCGRPFPGHDVRIVDDDGRRAARTARRPHRRARPVGDGRATSRIPAATAETLRDGWLTPATSATWRTASCSSAAGRRT